VRNIAYRNGLAGTCRARRKRNMRTSILSVVLYTGLAGGCTGSGQVTYSGEVAAPQLVEITPGVQVVADYDEPVFYSDTYYWRQQDGVWYRSRHHTGGWVRAEAPSAVLSIQTPSMYAHYHGGGVVSAHEAHERREEQRKLDKEERKDVKEERKELKEERKERKQEREEAEDRRHHEHD
jgi:hypothetical protein